MHPSRSTGYWLDRLRPALAQSVPEANRVITNTPAVQTWLQSAAMEAAAGLAGMGQVQAQMDAYSSMMQELKQRYPGLLDAVRQLTLGCADINIEWRPLSPEYTSLYLDFDQEMDVDYFWPLGHADSQHIETKLLELEAALPDDEPFTGHPNRKAAVLAHDETCITVLVSEHASGESPHAPAYELRSPSYQPAQNLSRQEAAGAISTFFERAST